MRNIFALLFLFIIGFSSVCFAEQNKDVDKDVDYFNTAMKIDISGDQKTASQIYYALLQSENTDVSLASALTLAQKFVAAEDFQAAIKYYKWILQQKPDFSQARFELALCYMKLNRWNQADYQLRLALAAKDLPDDAKQLMIFYRFLIKQNKSWNIWFNFGAAPDNNINNGKGGTECINTIFGSLCHTLKEPESAVGANLSLGGTYEFTLSDQWRWKSEANIYSNTYTNHDYNDLYLFAATGPRYIWSRGDIWLSGIGVRRWYGDKRYNWSYGTMLDTNYDFTPRLSGGLSFRFTNNTYDFYGDFLNGQTYSTNMRLSYSFNSWLYTVFRTGILRENTVNPIYSYWQPNISLGLGAEIPYGFHVYVEPSFYFSQYDDERLVVKDGNFSEIKEKDFLQRYAISISNNKFDIWGFVPTITVAYTRRDSNIWQQEYSKISAAFTLQQRF